MTTVRDATARDAARVGAVHAEAWRVAYQDLFDPEFLGSAVEARIRMWTDRWSAFERDASTLLVAETQQLVAGFVQFGPAEENPAEQEIYAFYVHPTFWGRGIAPLLMHEALRQLEQGTRGPVVLWTLGHAARARRFYEKTGWSASGRTRLHDFGDGVARPLTQYTR